LLSLPVCATSVGKEVTCKQSVIKSAAAPDKAVKQVVPSSDGSSLDQLLKGNDDTDDLGLWNITGGLTHGYQVHLKLTVNLSKWSWIREQQCQNSSGRL